MAEYITNQDKLASASGVTSQHLSGVKHGTRKISATLAILLALLTGMNILTWTHPTLKSKRIKQLNKFFQNQKKKEKEATQ